MLNYILSSTLYRRVRNIVICSLMFGSVSGALSKAAYATPDSEEKSRPNILFIVSEDNGQDLGCYGVKDVYTPNLDSLASSGIRFKNAYVPYSVCSPSRGTIYTGLYPHQNGQIGLATHNFQFYDNWKTLPGYMRDAGYKTMVMGKIHVNPEDLVNFDEWEIRSANFGKHKLRNYAAFADTFMTASDDPFFLMINLPDAHYPVQRDVEGLPTVKAPLDVEALPFIGVNTPHVVEYTSNYYTCMNRLDETVGMIFNSLKSSGKSRNTIIVYIGDHGAQFSRSKCSNYEAGLKIPLIVHYPSDYHKGKVSEKLVSTVDLLPTFLDMASSEERPELPGVSLTPILEPGREPNRWREYIYADGAGGAAALFYPRRSVRGVKYKLIHNMLYMKENPKFMAYAKHINGHFDGGTELKEIESASQQVQDAYAIWRNPPEYELYDLESDPWEFNNLSDKPQYKRELKRLKRELVKWQKETNDPFYDEDKFNRYVKEVESKKGQKGRNIEWEYPSYFYDK